MPRRRLKVLEVDGVRPAYALTLLWAVLAVATTLGAGLLADYDILWWRDVTYAGVVIGVLGTRHVVKRRRRLQSR